MKLSILMPVYNEKDSIDNIIAKVYSIDLQTVSKEVIIVDDCSKDGTREILLKLQKKYNFKLYLHNINQGKGGAIKTALKYTTGDIIIFQDADLEYEPNDYSKLILPIIEGKADFVLGNRFHKGNSIPIKSFYDYIHYLGNRFEGFILSIIYFKHIKDAWTCYKVFKKDIINANIINGNRFDYEIELISKILRKHPRLSQVNIQYNPRSFQEGKKITWKDGLKAFLITLKYRFID